MNNNYHDYICKLYNFSIDQIRNITFQVTNDCCCACTYCYQINKQKDYMPIEVGYGIVDFLFKMYNEDNKNNFINKSTKGLIFEFIGGEPLMNIDLIQQVCDYFIQKAVQENPEWLLYWRISISTNGKYYFSEKVQSFLKQYKNFISLNITLDGPEEVHDTCRIYHNGKGNFHDAYKAFLHYQKFYDPSPSTKVTISKENLPLLNHIIDFFLEQNINDLIITVAFEPEWTLQDAQLYYKQLIILADKILNNDVYVDCSLFNEDLFQPLPETEIQTWCGGTGQMLSFDPNGIAYPCLRYMPSSLGNNIKPIIIGSYKEGIYNTPASLQIKEDFLKITRKTQSTSTCFSCPIAAGCSYCSAWNYQCFGTANSRCINICWMHRACALANVYFWNNFYIKNNSDQSFSLYLDKETSIQIIGEQEYNKLLQLIERAKNGENNPNNIRR